ncbi:zinc finger protein 64 homolog, isoforms 3 and 4-like [Trichogramma pretiosum]|uniref:zinc finger protein 64 homolog, isoforms 3 and 4-like n=1 Tax=Trichogramma pretiosum TaxID=7493 RepID=UPI0006C9435C|nr:zinc finger protein 64 homolog, isoforms 3 and 4-like [Trichogramma pretiosum]
MNYSDGSKTKTIIKIETTDEVKQELFAGVSDKLNFDCEPGLRNKKRKITNKGNNEHNLKRHIRTVHNDDMHDCDIYGKKYSTKDNLKKHIDSLHDGITHTCDICGKKYSAKKRHFH